MGSGWQPGASPLILVSDWLGRTEVSGVVEFPGRKLSLGEVFKQPK